MSDTSPYAIRLELIKLAKEIAMEEWYQRRDKSNREYDIQCQRFANGEIGPDFSYALIDPPTEEEIVEKAKRFNQFVSNQK